MVKKLKKSNRFEWICVFYLKSLDLWKTIQMPASYPFFKCISCSSRVQKAIAYTTGCMPIVVVNDRRVKLSSEFDDGDFTKHCRGQGARYNDPTLPAYVEYVEGLHFNFSGCFSGFCCFCALQSGFGSESFLSAGCVNCMRKEAARAEFAKLYRIRGASWDDGRWAALPAAVLDNILRIFSGESLSIVDGVVGAMQIANE